MKQGLLFWLCLLVIAPLTAQEKPQAEWYGTGTWDADSLGNHRIVVAVDKPADAVLATLNWRRRDLHPEQCGVIVVDATTGQRITNVVRLYADRERGEIAFQPQTVPGNYYIYYLKSVSTGSRYYPTVHYPDMEATATTDWLQKNRLTGKKTPALPAARLVQYQAIDDFHSFYPMEVIATEAEKVALLRQQPADPYILFTEDRRYPIRMTNDIPYKWVEENRHDYFKGTADKGEYYVFQVGVWAAREAVEQLHVSYSDLTNAATGEQIPASAFTCFNTEGIDVTGTVFEKECSVEKGKVQALWIGAMVPEQLSAGCYQGCVTISAANAEPKQIALELTVTDQVIADHGDNEPWRHSRLRWLNSQIGFDDEVVAPYIPVGLKEKQLSILGRTVQLADNGLPQSITSYFEETLTHIGTEGRALLSEPMQLVADGGDWENLDFAITKHKPGAVAWKTMNQNDRFLMQLEGELESDGNITYRVTLIAQKDGTIQDVALRTELAPGIAKYMMGLGEKGGYCPKNFDWKWDVEKNQDAIWAGDVNAGLQLRFYDNQYERPLNTNFYHQKPLHMPVSWSNAGQGGIRIRPDGTSTRVEAYSGKREVKRGDRLYYYFNVLITPFRTIDTNKQWKNRFYHGYQFIDDTYEFGATVVNIHHANAINPYINYPFLRPKEMKSYIDGAHAKQMKVKIYNTVRELSNHCVELFALRSLNGEIFSQGEGGGYSWLQEHLDQDYIAAWFSYHVQCAAIVNTGVSRWHNYYMEGLDWLLKHVGIDGIYIDDLAFDRMSMKRVRKILNRTNPGALIDLHSANQYNERDGFANSANLYLEHFPYIDRLWFGEYFDYNMPPEFWMVEVSGLPYGLMGEMLWEGGNKWRGMLYGMTGRNPGYGVDNRSLWQFWDQFGMQDSEMIGYWVSSNPVKTGREKTLATLYRHANGKKMLLSLATWEPQDAPVDLQIDWNALGLDPAKATLHAPAIADFQEEKEWKPGETITVPQGKGWLIIIE
ncbi:MAG: glycoside hydrolase domain-containing protein [Parabacteroides sp.]